MTLAPLALFVLLAAPPAAASEPAAATSRATAAATAAATSAAPAAEPRIADSRSADPWAPLRFLVGTWKTESGQGKPGEAVGGGFAFEIELDGKVAVRRGRAEYAPRAGESSGAVHEDLTVLQPKGAGFQAWYWDNEGHLIRYAVRSEAGTVIFESEPGPGPRFRLVYARRGADLVEVSFSIAPPGKGFAPYVTGLARRVRDPS